MGKTNRLFGIRTKKTNALSKPKRKELKSFNEFKKPCDMAEKNARRQDV